MPDQKQILEWLTGCPASDINFQNNLLLATTGTCEKALQDTSLKKTARAAIEARRRKVEKSLPHPAAHKKAGASATDLALASKSAPGKSHSGVDPRDYIRAMIRTEVAERGIPEKAFGDILYAQTLDSLEEDAEMAAFDGVLAAVKVWKPGAKGVRTITLADLDVMPPVRRVGRAKAVSLDVLETQIRDLLSADFSREQAFRNEAVYDRVAVGLCLLKGREIHLRESTTQFQKGNKGRGGNVSTPSPKAEAKADQGFLGWIEEQFPGFSTRTARNYMNAARNCGLTSDHGLEDVDALKAAQALHDKTAKELYQLADALKTPEPPAPEPRRNLVMEAQSDLFATLDQMIVLRDDMDCDDAVFETTTTRLQGTLEKWTGCKWIMADSNDAAMHGDMHGDGHTAKGAKGAKKKKGTRK